MNISISPFALFFYLVAIRNFDFYLNRILSFSYVRWLHTLSDQLNLWITD